MQRVGAAAAAAAAAAMGTATYVSRILRSLPTKIKPSPFSTGKALFYSPTLNKVPLNFFSETTTFFNSSFTSLSSIALTRRLFTSQSRNTNSPIAFNFSDSEDEQDQPDKGKTKPINQIDKSKLPPPYDPFNKKPVIEEPKDPKNLQEIFHKMRTEGFMNEAIKMFDGLSKDGLTHEAIELFGLIKDKGNMPDVVAHTAVMEAYVNAGGHSKEALKVFLRMLSSGVKPNAYTYSVLIKGLSKDGKLKDAKKYVLEMMDKGIRPNVGTYTSVFEAFTKEEKLDEGRELLDQMKAKGFVPDEKAVRDHLSNRGQVFRSVMNLLFNK